MQMRDLDEICMQILNSEHGIAEGKTLVVEQP